MTTVHTKGTQTFPRPFPKLHSSWNLRIKRRYFWRSHLLFSISFNPCETCLNSLAQHTPQALHTPLNSIVDIHRWYLTHFHPRPYTPLVIYWRRNIQTGSEIHPIYPISWCVLFPLAPLYESPLNHPVLGWTPSILDYPFPGVNFSGYTIWPTSMDRQNTLSWQNSIRSTAFFSAQSLAHTSFFQPSLMHS